MRIDTNHAHAKTQATGKTAKAASTEKAPKAAKSEAVEAPKETVSFSYLPQDEALTAPEQGQIDGKVEAGPTGPRIKVSVPRNFPQAAPDASGNFSYEIDDPKFDSANSYYITNQTLNMAQEYAGRELPWSFTESLGREQILIHPHAGSGVVNAFYSSDAGSVNYFNYTTEDRSVHRTGIMPDVVAHETGHAILDAIRPTYIQSLAVPAGGYHESFGDMVSMLRALHEPTVLAELKAESKGDLGSSNIVTRLAEQLGVDAYGTPYLRDAVNEHKYADQHFLPYTDPSMHGNGFGTEPHAYATLFTGAFYDLFNGVYNAVSADPDLSFSDSVAAARDAVGQLLFRATELAPIGNPAYPEMAEAFLQADAIDNDGALRPFIEEAFRGRNILTDKNVENFDAKMASVPNVKLRKSALEATGAMDFLADKREALNLPEGVSFEFNKSYKNDKGETFLTYTTTRQGDLDDSDFGTNEGSKYEGVGGLVLAFDDKGKMFANNYDEVSDREMNDIKDQVRSLSLAGNLIMGEGDAHNHGAREAIHVQTVNTASGPVLRKSGVLYC